MPDICFEKEYKSTMLRIGGAMLMFVALFNVLFLLIPIIGEALDSVLNEKTVYIITDLLNDAAYLFSFLFPAGFFYMISKKKRTEPVMTTVRLDKSFPLMLVGGIAVIIAAAYLNAYIMELFGYSRFMEQVASSEVLDENYKLILMVISTALVPAFCEEFLFRGVILSNLLPYGKATAVITSAMLFGLMHQNAGQILYTTVAGIVLGLVYVRTRSIWGGILLHFFNNLISVAEQLFYDRLDEATASEWCLRLEATLFVLGVVCVIILICAERKKKRDFTRSGFGVVLEPDEGYIERRLEKGAAVKLFFTPTVIVFVCISVAQMLLLILMSLGMLEL